MTSEGEVKTRHALEMQTNTEFYSELESFEIIQFDVNTNSFLFKDFSKFELSQTDETQNSMKIKKKTQLGSTDFSNDMEYKKKKKWKPLHENNLGFITPSFSRCWDSDDECDDCSIGSIENGHCSICLADREEAVIESKYNKRIIDELNNVKIRKTKKLKHRKLNKERKYIHRAHAPIRYWTKRHDVVYHIHHRIYKKSKFSHRQSLETHKYGKDGYTIAELHNLKLKLKAHLHRKTIEQNKDLNCPMKYVLEYDNLDLSLDEELHTILLLLQNRDILPEDYDVLLQLDDRVSKKTIDETTLNKFKKEAVREADITQRCTICQENYIEEQFQKILPCGHRFHDTCIDEWLSTASLNCPIDGLPVNS